MKYRILGRTGMKVSVVGVGAWQFGGEWGKDYIQKEVDAIIDKARQVGVNLIDTAECYGDHLSESLVGGAVRKDRERWIIATKFGHKFHHFMDRTEHWTAAEVRQQLEDSLRALKTDYVDLYQFHSGNDAAFQQDDLWEMLRKQVEAGKVRHVGISIRRSGAEPQIEAATKVGAETIQVVYNRLEPEAEREILPSCQRQNLGVLARVPMASGYLSGKYKPGATFGANDFRSTQAREAVDRKLEAVARIQREEVPAGVPMAQWALAWCLRHQAVTCVIPGCKSPEQVESNAKAVDLGDFVRGDHPQSAR